MHNGAATGVNQQQRVPVDIPEAWGRPARCNGLQTVACGLANKGVCGPAIMANM